MNCYELANEAEHHFLCLLADKNYVVSSSINGDDNGIAVISATEVIKTLMKIWQLMAGM